jgi:hypothetical protein
MLLSAAAQADWRHHRREPLFGRPRFALPGVPRALARGLVAAKQVRRRGVWCCPSRLLRGTPLSPRRRRVSSELYPPAGRSVASRRPFRVAESSASKALKYPSHLLRIAYPKPVRRTSRTYRQEQGKAIHGDLGGRRASGPPDDGARARPVSGCAARDGHLAATGPARSRKMRL